MTLRRLQVSDFRCLQSTQLDFDSRFTLISGPNGSGKTSLLEAIYVLGRGRSFRTRRLDHLIRAGTERFVTVGSVELSARDVRIGVEGSAQGMKARLGGERVSSLAELAVALPVQIIDPEVHRLIEEGPSRRRRFLDWGVFHVEHRFLTHWQQFQQALKQRNAGLRLRQPRPVVSAWDGELVRLGNLIDAARSAYVQQLAPAARAVMMSLLGRELELAFRSGWPRDTTFELALRDSWWRDVESGSTSVGPQRAELSVRLDGEGVKDRVSRGQQKLLAAGLLLAQIRLFPSTAEVRPTLLLDDPAAELDTDRLQGLIAEVSDQNLQLIVTSLDDRFDAFGAPGNRFRIESGSVRPA